MFGQRAEQLRHAEILQRRAEIDRRQMAFAIGGQRRKRGRPALRQLDLLLQLGVHLRLKMRAHGVAADALALPGPPKTMNSSAYRS